MPSVDGWSHLVCTPSVSHERIDRFVGELCTATRESIPSAAYSMCP
jgi:hypothetical protein